MYMCMAFRTDIQYLDFSILVKVVESVCTRLRLESDQHWVDELEKQGNGNGTYGPMGKYKIHGNIQFSKVKGAYWRQNLNTWLLRRDKFECMAFEEGQIMTPGTHVQ